MDSIKNRNSPNKALNFQAFREALAIETDFLRNAENKNVRSIISIFTGQFLKS
jgi:hypothetical protein